MVRCTSCGNENEDNAAFCDTCGTLLGAAGTAHTPAVVSPAAASGNVCPACGSAVVPGEAFCEQCGAALDALLPASTVAPPAQQIAPALPRVLRLLIKPNDTEVTFPNKPEAIIGRSDPASQFFPDIDLDRFDALNQGVSRRHAKVQVRGDQIMIEDLDTANGTAINKQRLAPRLAQPIHDGDELRFGTLTATVRLS